MLTQSVLAARVVGTRPFLSSSSLPFSSSSCRTFQRTVPPAATKKLLAGLFERSNPFAVPLTTTNIVENDPYRERKYHLHVQSTRNNTILSFTDRKGLILSWVSGGSVGFKNVQRSGYEAGYQCALKMFQRIAEEKKTGPMSLEILFKGFGQGREAVYRALMAAEGAEVRAVVKKFTDRTPIKIGGTRARKKRIL
jgi:small subunit ribosomal protein S11